MSEMDNKEGRWEYKATVLAGQNDVLYLPRLFQNKLASVGVKPGTGGSCLVEYTLAPYADVVADPSLVTWREWPNGTATISTDDVLDGPVTALRMTSTTADGEWEVLL